LVTKFLYLPKKFWELREKNLVIQSRVAINPTIEKKNGHQLG
jgi:hypothetical protein